MLSPQMPEDKGLGRAGQVASDRDKDEAETNRRRRIGRIVFVLLLVGILYGGYRLIRFELVGQYIQETDDAYIRADMVTVSSKLSGTIRSVNARDNQQVPRGALLAQIDPTDFANHVADADAQIAVARANQDAADASVGQAATGIIQADAALAAARRDLAYLDRQVALYRPLVATGAEPRQAYDQYVANRDKARADVTAKLAAVAAARSQLVSARAQKEQAAAQMRSAEVKKSTMQGDLDRSRIVAPIGGTVASSALRVGQFVQPGQRLLSIVPTQEIYVEANFKETQIGLMRPGQRVGIRIDALPGIAFSGYVESVSPGTGANFSLIPPQNATGNFTKIVQRVPVRIFIDAGPESRRVLVPGLSVKVEVDTGSAKAARDAIEREQEATGGR